MTWGEFTTLLAGIMPETPLGKIVEIRSESDKDALKNFTPSQHKIRNKWRSRMSKLMISDKVSAEQQIKQFQQAMKQAFSK